MRLHLLKLYPDLLPFPGNDVSATILGWQGKQYGWSVQVDTLEQGAPWPDQPYDVILLGSSFTHISSDLLEALSAVRSKLHAQVQSGALLLVSGISTCLITRTVELPGENAGDGLLEVDGLHFLEGRSRLIAPVKSGWIVVRSPFVPHLVVGELYRHCMFSAKTAEEGGPFGEITAAMRILDNGDHKEKKGRSEPFFKLRPRKVLSGASLSHSTDDQDSLKWRRFGWVRPYGRGMIIALPWVGAYLSYNPHLVTYLLSIVSTVQGGPAELPAIDAGFSWEAYHHILKRMGLSETV
ncbi:MAG: hypothetical protein IMX04_06615 [Candidatus Carbobacillus altaicus]|uniref:CobB/CobQ-like glutamine amidotransferase domain-containing protein n=1 Tax=Candidatus Carbonibacillus altaicus TaxID=2163959 RepID=A0A2R6Y3H5_9BACL|nr:hypothetical protein [Candidatus Carbobacillus altaicus]PTQ57229.1 MAG: hypothetical protein BSOLF_1994 [Candidatus Carbobacillus altaicus]